MEEAACRDDIRATWAARAFGANCGVQSAVFFLQHRRELEGALHTHATFLLLCHERIAATTKAATYMEAVQNVATGVYASAEMRSLLRRRAFEADILAAEERRRRSDDAAREAAFLAKRSEARAWEHEKASLANRACKSELAANRARVAALREAERQNGPKDPIRAALEAAIDATAKPLADSTLSQTATDADGTATDPNSPMGRASSMASFRSSASGGAVSYAKRRAMRHRQRVLDDEERARDAIATEEAARLNAIVSLFDRHIPIGPNGADCIRDRRAAEVAAAKMAEARARHRAEQLALDAERLQLRLRDERHLDELRARCAILEAEADDCRSRIATEETDAWALLVERAEAEHDVADAHDRRHAAMAQRQAYLRERDARLTAATTLLSSCFIGAVVRRRLRLVAQRPVEVRALCADEHRQAKQLVQGEVISFMDVLQYFVITAPEPAVCAQHAPHAVVTPDCVPAVEALARRRIALDWAADHERFTAMHAGEIAAATELPEHLRGRRVECARKVQAVWRGFKLRVFFDREWRDRLTFERMRRVKARMSLRAEQDIEALHRANIAEEEAAALDHIIAVMHPAGVAHVHRREACAVRLQAAVRGFLFRSRRLTAIKEAFWLERYNSTRRKQRARTAPPMY